jgi:hypothetical protein
VPGVASTWNSDLLFFMFRACCAVEQDNPVPFKAHLFEKECCMLSNQTKLAVAGAYNGTLMCQFEVEQENLKNHMLSEVGDYFEFNPESEQFDKAVVLSELEASSYPEMLDLMRNIGFRAAPAWKPEFLLWQLESFLWHKFIDETPVDWETGASTLFPEQHDDCDPSDTLA